MDRIRSLSEVAWAVVYFVLATISLWLATHEAGAPWRVLHWIEVIAFYAISFSFVWVLFADRRADREMHSLHC